MSLFFTFMILTRQSQYMGYVHNIKTPINGQKLHILVNIVYTMWSLLYLIITHHRIRYILEITYLKHQGDTKWIGDYKL